MRPLLAAALTGTLVGLAAGAAPAGEKRTAQAVRLTGPLVLDGVPDEPAWQPAPRNTDFTYPLSVGLLADGLTRGQPIPKEAQTEFRVLYDDTTLYIGLVCHEPHPDQIEIQATEPHDDALWADDDIEVFIDPTGRRETYYQFAVNARGMKTDLYYIEKGNTQVGGWSTVWTARTRIGQDRWTAELALPLAAFHLAPIAADRPWAFQVCRTRRPKPSYFSVWSPATGYHKIDEIGFLAGIQLARSYMPLLGEKPEFRLEPAAKGYAVTAAIWMENLSSRPFDGTVALAIDTAGAAGAQAPLRLDPGRRTRVVLTGASVPAVGKYTYYFTARESGAAADCFARRWLGWFRYETFRLVLTRPNYRDTIYATQAIDAVAGRIELALPDEKLQGLSLEVTLDGGPKGGVHRVTPAIQDRRAEFSIPAQALPVGEHLLTVRLLRGAAGQSEVVAQETRRVRRLGRAPAVEVRVDEEGNFRVNGVPLFIRGWYGSTAYMISTASFPYAQLPSSTNFIMGGSQELALRQGFFTLYGLTYIVPDSRKDEPISEEIRKKLREAVEAVRYDSHVVGYYLSDEPECRGVSADYLRSAYEFLRELDPYRYVFIVSRSPAEYVEACDVICPHPYLSPRVEQGVRDFGTPARKLIEVTREAVAAAGSRKGAWIMPQTFRYVGTEHPNFLESRWFAMAGVANGVKGVVPFIFDGYWNHRDSRLAMTYVFEELAFLEAPWVAPGSDVPITVQTAGQVSARAKLFSPTPRDPKHLFIVAVNETRQPTRAVFTVPAVLQARDRTRLIVIREHRLVPVAGPQFSDDFGPLGVHVYTTNDALPYFKSLAQIDAEIAEAARRARKPGDLLTDPAVGWKVASGLKLLFDDDQETHENLTDGVLDAAGWFPVYADRQGLTIAFDQEVAFRRVWLVTPNIRALDLQSSLDGRTWQTVHAWKDQSLPELTWEGAPVRARYVQFLVRETRNGYGTWAVPDISELALFR